MDVHRRAHSIVCIHNWNNVQRNQLRQGAEQILTGLLVVEVRFRHQHLQEKKMYFVNIFVLQNKFDQRSGQCAWRAIAEVKQR
jgi:hypothetical protein